MPPRLSLIICTRNRAELLQECLNSLQRIHPPSLAWELLVVDNASTDHTLDICRRAQESLPQLRYIYCENVGLSRARNHGWQQARGQWVGYLDDDCWVPPQFLAIAAQNIERGDCTAFGGTYYAWHPYGRPVWLPEHYGTKPLLRPDRGYLPKGSYLSGGVFFVRRSFLRTRNGFREDLGMSQHLGYGEEVDLQIRLQQHGHRPIFDPALFMHHAVMPHKHHLRWHLQDAFTRGRDNVPLARGGPPIGVALVQFLGSLGTALLLKGPRQLIRTTRTGGHWKGWLLAVSYPPLYRLGYFWRCCRSALRQKAKDAPSSTGFLRKLRKTRPEDST